MNLEAFWRITFSSKTDNGMGNVTLTSSRVYGGDSGFDFIGTYSVTNDDFNATVDVAKKPNGPLPSIFGPGVDRFSVVINGTVSSDERTITGNGHIQGMPQLTLNVTFDRLADLV